MQKEIEHFFRIRKCMLQNESVARLESVINDFDFEREAFVVSKILATQPNDCPQPLLFEALAREEFHREYVACLLSCGANPNIPGVGRFSMYTCLFTAAHKWEYDLPVIETLVAYGASVVSSSQELKCPFTTALKRDKVELLKYFFSRKEVLAAMDKEERLFYFLSRSMQRVRLSCPLLWKVMKNNDFPFVAYEMSSDSEEKSRRRCSLADVFLWSLLYISEGKLFTQIVNIIIDVISSGAPVDTYLHLISVFRRNIPYVLDGEGYGLVDVYPAPRSTEALNERCKSLKEDMELGESHSVLVYLLLVLYRYGGINFGKNVFIVEILNYLRSRKKLCWHCEEEYHALKKLSSISNNVNSLQKICCMKIRTHLSTLQRNHNICPSILSLPVPPMITKILLLQRDK